MQWSKACKLLQACNTVCYCSDIIYSVHRNIYPPYPGEWTVYISHQCFTALAVASQLTWKVCYDSFNYVQLLLLLFITNNMSFTSTSASTCRSHVVSMGWCCAELSACFLGVTRWNINWELVYAEMQWFPTGGSRSQPHPLAMFIKGGLCKRQEQRSFYCLKTHNIMSVCLIRFNVVLTLFLSSNYTSIGFHSSWWCEVTIDWNTALMSGVKFGCWG